MQHHAAFHLGLQCSPNTPLGVSSIQRVTLMTLFGVSMSCILITVICVMQIVTLSLRNPSNACVFIKGMVNRCNLDTT